MKEDILEQVVDEYLQHRGFFTIHNLRFKPSAAHADFDSNQDSVPSDIDVVGFNPLLHGADRVWAVSCKSWQSGFNTAARINALTQHETKSKRHLAKRFRELWIPKWSEAFRNRLEAVSGQMAFRYSIAVTKLKGDPETFIHHQRVKENLAGNEMTFLTLQEMWTYVMKSITTTPASSQIGRLAQLLKAAGLAK